MVGVDLTNADLSGTDLTGVDLSGATLCDAFLHGTKFHGTNLAETEFGGAKLKGAAFLDVDLSVAKGLESVRHQGPSTVGTDTLMRSRRKLPLSFLKECGVHDEVLAYLPSLVGKIFDFYSCFISYSSKDDEFAKHLHARLQQEKIRVWFAPEDIEGGRKLYDQIDEAICLHEKLLLVLSSESMSSEWVSTEIRRTRKAERDQGCQKLFPIRLCNMDTLRRWERFDADSGKDLAVELREYYIPDFSHWKDHESFEAAFKRLLHDLRKDEPTMRRPPDSG